MSRPQNTAEIINFESYRRQRTEEQAEQATMAPMLVWVPMWVMVPQETTQPTQ